VVETPDAASYVDAILRLAEDPELRGQMGRAACETSRRFDWDACCARVVAAYREFGGWPAAAAPGANVGT